MRTCAPAVLKIALRVSKLIDVREFQIRASRAGVEEWRATLTDYDRRNLNNPTIAWRKWTAATRVKKPKPRSAGVSASEHGRAQATAEQLQARVMELEEELAAAREPEPGRPETLEDLRERMAALLRELSKDERRWEINRIMKAVDLDIHDWVSTMTIGRKRG